MTDKNKEIIFILKEILEKNLNINIQKIYLFGSRLNKKFDKHSDYDILIILKNDYDWKLEEKIYDVSYELMLKYDIILDIKIISINELNTLRGKQPYILNALKSHIFI